MMERIKREYPYRGLEGIRIFVDETDTHLKFTDADETDSYLKFTDCHIYVKLTSL